MCAVFWFAKIAYAVQCFEQLHTQTHGTAIWLGWGSGEKVWWFTWVLFRLAILIPFLPHFRFNATEVVQNVMHYAAREQTVPASSSKQLPVRESSPGIDRINTCACVGASECTCTTFCLPTGLNTPSSFPQPAMHPLHVSGPTFGPHTLLLITYSCPAFYRPNVYDCV